MDAYNLALLRNQELIDMLTHVVARVTTDVAKTTDGLPDFDKTPQSLELHTRMTRQVIEHELIRQYGD